MLTFILTCGPTSIRCEARTVREAFDHGFALLGHLSRGISCICAR